LAGAWYFGSGAEYGPSYLLENDVILVTINYRVGVFGLFMDHYHYHELLGIEMRANTGTNIEQDF
jgi:carboxylesterase type B